MMMMISIAILLVLLVQNTFNGKQLKINYKKSY